MNIKFKSSIAIICACLLADLNLYPHSVKNNNVQNNSKTNSVHNKSHIKALTKNGAEILNLTIKNNKTVSSKIKGQKAYRLEKHKAICNFAPKISASWTLQGGNSITGGKPVPQKHELTFDIKLNLFNKLRDVVGLYIAEHKNNSEMYKTVSSINEEIKDVINIVAKLKQNTDDLEHLRQLLNHIQALLKIAQNQQKTDVANKSELRAVILEEKKVKLDIENAQNKIASLTHDLESRTKTKYTKSMIADVFEHNAATDAQIRDISNNATKYLANNATIKQAQSDIKIKRLQKHSSIISNTPLPEVNVFYSLGASRTKNINPALGDGWKFENVKFGREHWGHSFGINMHFNILSAPDIIESIQQFKVFDAQLDSYLATKAKVEESLKSAYKRYTNTVAIIEHQKQVVALKKDNIEIIKKQRQIGTKSLKDVLEASTKWYDDLKKLGEFKVQLTNLIAEIYILSGILLPAHSLQRDIDSEDIPSIHSKSYFASAR